MEEDQKGLTLRDLMAREGPGPQDKPAQLLTDLNNQENCTTNAEALKDLIA